MFVDVQIQVIEHDGLHGSLAKNSPVAIVAHLRIFSKCNVNVTCAYGLARSLSSFLQLDLIFKMFRLPIQSHHIFQVWQAGSV